MAGAVHLVVWSDYLCPWCHLAAARLERLEQELGPALALEWRAFLLRPTPDPGRTLERFRTYTQSWRRPGAEPDAPAFIPWTTDAGPPSHSIPPHVAAKAAAALGPAAFRAFRPRLFRAYFEENRDITDRATLQALWREAGLAAAAFSTIDDPAHEAAVLDDHRAALAHGVTGVPSAMLAGTDVPMLGVLTYETYRRWVTRARERAT